MAAFGGGYPGQAPPPPGSMIASNPFGAAVAAAGQPMTSPFGSALPAIGAPPTAPFGGGVQGVPPPPPTGMPQGFCQPGMPSAPPVASGPFPGPGLEPPPQGRPQADPSPAQFYSQSLTQSAPGGYQGAPMAQPMAQPGMPGAGNPQQDAQLAAFVRDLDMNNASPTFVRSTIAKLPDTFSAKQKLSVPMGIIIQPLAQPTPEEGEVPSVNFGAVGTIVRCKSCRTYINPFIQWEANGRRWQCNLCGFSQTTPDSYFASLDDTGKRTDKFQRPELHRGTVEYIAPGEYMVRPPQPPVFVFVIDVSYAAVATGMLDVVVGGIKEAIQSGDLPGGERTQVGIITYDTSLHFYNLNPNLSQPQMLVVSDLEDLFLPLPDDILVNVADSESSILSLLDSLPVIFRDTKVSESCTGSAVRGAYMAMKHIGGKMCVFQSCIPSVGENSLKSTRDNPRLLGTDREVELLRPANELYKDLATELTRAQIAVEMFVAPQSYVDLASVVPLAKFTGGDVRYYPFFHAQQQGPKLKSELIHVLTRYMGWEAVMRVRVSKGWKLTKYYGHLHMRGQDLLVVPNCHADQTFAVTVDMEEGATPDPILCMQSALLYTNSDGERRIRVQTWAAVTARNFQDVIASVDVQATVCMLSHISLESSVKATLAEGRNKLQTCCQQMIVQSQQVSNSQALTFLPLYIMGMLKSLAFRATPDIGADVRTSIWMRLESLSVAQLSRYFCPRMLPLHALPDGCGALDERGSAALPELLNLSSEAMSQDGVYLLDDGECMVMWLGRAVDANFLHSVFGVASLEELDPATAEAALGANGNELSTRIARIVGQVRTENVVPFQELHVVRQGDAKESKFFASLIEDRTVGLQTSYPEFLQRMGYRQPQQAAPPAPLTGARR